MDFFVSHSSKDKEQVCSIVEELEKIGAHCWMAPRDVSGNYAVAINEAIGNCKVFLLCLSKNSAKSEHVLNEIEMVYRHNKRLSTPIPISPLCLEPIDIDDPCLDIIMYYISKINFISPKNYIAHDIAEEVLLKNDNILHLKQKVKRPREKSLYFDSKREDNRLKIQDELCQKFDFDIYKRIISSYNSPRILDVGCGNGRMLLTRLDRIGSVDYRYLGIDREKSKIQEASAFYPDVDFIELDVENKSFQEQLYDSMERMSYEKFDIINISMLLLHLKNQCRLFRILRRVLAPGGTIVIKDIDDGLNIAYPDSDNCFERIYKICYNNETSGDRNNGRQIFTYLKKAGFTDIILEKSGFSTIGLSYEEKEDFFAMYFKFILGDIQWMKEKYPQDKAISEDCNWYEENYDEIYNSFMEPDFSFTLGFQMYSVRI